MDNLIEELRKIAKLHYRIAKQGKDPDLVHELVERTSSYRKQALAGQAHEVLQNKPELISAINSMKLALNKVSPEINIKPEQAIADLTALIQKEVPALEKALQDVSLQTKLSSKKRKRLV